MVHHRNPNIQVFGPLMSKSPLWRQLNVGGEITKGPRSFNKVESRHSIHCTLTSKINLPGSLLVLVLRHCPTRLFVIRHFVLRHCPTRHFVLRHFVLRHCPTRHFVLRNFVLQHNIITTLRHHNTTPLEHYGITTLCHHNTTPSWTLQHILFFL